MLFRSLMKKDIDLIGCSAFGYWRDVGNPESYREVHDDILNERVEFNFEGIKKVFPDGILYSAQKYELKDGVDILDKVVLGKNVTIGKGVKLHNVVIGDNVIVDDFCKIRNSVIWDNVEIQNNVILDSCVICNNNILGNNMQAKAGLILAEGCEVGSQIGRAHV